MLKNLIEAQGLQINQLLASQVKNNHEGQISSQERGNNKRREENHASADERKVVNLVHLLERF